MSISLGAEQNYYYSQVYIQERSAEKRDVALHGRAVPNPNQQHIRFSQTHRGVVISNNQVQFISSVTDSLAPI
jgi:hypothetical protein